MRRAVRYYYSYLDQKEPLLFQLVTHLADQFEKVFPELQQQQSFIERVVREEEEAFLRTLDKGIKIFNEYIAKGTGRSASSDSKKKNAFLVLSHLN